MLLTSRPDLQAGRARIRHPPAGYPTEHGQTSGGGRTRWPGSGLTSLPMRITLRDLTVALIAASATLSAVALAQEKAALLPSTAFDWNAFPVRTQAYGVSRQIVRQPT